MRCTVVAIVLSFLTGAAWAGDQPAVEVHGAIRDIMRRGDTGPRVDLMTLDTVPHLYALGARAGLKGEIIILDGSPFLSWVKAGSLKVANTPEGEATLLVLARVDAWQSYPIPPGVTTAAGLEQFVPELALKAGLDTSMAFPFMITGSPVEVHWHVIDWPEGDSVHTHEKHRSTGLSGTIEEGEVTILGFYSSKHHGVFTHHTTNMHMHVVNDDHTMAGHVDGLILQPGTQLLLPKPQ